MSAFLSWPWKILHGLIILNFLAEIGYASWIIFVVLAPDAASGPLGAAAADLPMDLMLRRRLYATEDWLAMSGLSLYLAITEILPRTLWAMWQKSKARPE